MDITFFYNSLKSVVMFKIYFFNLKHTHYLYFDELFFSFFFHFFFHFFCRADKPVLYRIYVYIYIIFIYFIYKENWKGIYIFLSLISFVFIIIIFFGVVFLKILIYVPIYLMTTNIIK